MSRDHYKGVPKTRDAKLDKDGRIVPLSNRAESADVRTNAVYTEMSGEPKSRIRIYARPTGSDTEGDGSLEKPYRTFFKCMEHVPLNADGRVFYFDISDIGTEVIDQVTVSFPPIVGGGGLYNVLTHPLQEFADAGNNYFREGVINIVASPTVLDSFTPDSMISDPETNNKSFVKAGANWTPDEFKGKLVTNYKNSMYTIFSNTEDTIEVGTSLNISADELSIVEPSAVLQYGSSTRPDHSGFTPMFDLAPIKASLVMWGIGFKGPGGFSSAVDMIAENMINITGCTFDGGLFVRGHNFIEMDGVYTSPGSTVIFGGPTVYTRYSFFDQPGYWDSGSAGPDAHVVYNSLLYGLPGFPHYISEGTGVTYHGGPMTIVSTTVVSGTGSGIQVGSGGPVTLDRVSVRDCPGDGVLVVEGGIVTLRRTYGADNAGYGVNAQNGGRVLIRDTATSVTGDSGDFKIGVQSSDTWTNFNSGFKATLDTTAVSGTLSRMHNPSAY